MGLVNAETYLRVFAEAELRRLRLQRRLGAADTFPDVDVPLVSAVASAFARMEALDRDRAAAIVEDLKTALTIRSPHRRRYGFAQLLARQSHWPGTGAASPTPAGPVSVTPIGQTLRVRDGGGDTDIYLTALITSAALSCVGAGILRQGGSRRAGPAAYPYLAVPSLSAVDEAGLAYDLLFRGGGGRTWVTGQFTLAPKSPVGHQGLPTGAAWLDVGHKKTSVRIDLTARWPTAQATVTPSGLGPGERLLRVRAETLLANNCLEVPDGLPALNAVVQALRAVGALPAESAVPRQIAALGRRYRRLADDDADRSGELPARWTSILRERAGKKWARGYGGRGAPHAGGIPGGRPPGAIQLAHLCAVFPRVDEITTVLSGLITVGGITMLYGAFFGCLGEDDADGPCIWLRDDSGQWHVAAQGGWEDDGVIAFSATVDPPLAPTVTAVDILIVGRSADIRACVPLTWWTP